jgi:hypothetical protein
LAQIYGNPGKEDGDRKVFEALKALSSECIVYAQPKLVHKSENANPEYVIVNKNWGVIVLEVKDWVQIDKIDRHSLKVYRTERHKWEEERNPLSQARNAAIILTNMLTEDPDLRNYAGKLDFSYTYGVALPKLFGASINNCNYHWGQGHVLGMLDITKDKITEKIADIPVKFRCLMTDTQVRAVCAIIDGRNRVVDKNTGEFKGVLDQQQESIAKEDLAAQQVEPEPPTVSQHTLLADLFPEPAARQKQLEREVPQEVINLKSDMHVRLVRGFAGTGKTDVLILRAQYLCEQYPEKRILVTTFNDPLYKNRLQPELAHLKKRVDVIKFDSLCSAVCKKRFGKWHEPQPVRGLVAHMAERVPEVNDWGIDFLSDEFVWIKEAGRTKSEDYINKSREGRGAESGRTFSREQKKAIFGLFEKYEQELIEIASVDWAGMHDKTHKYLEECIQPEKKYDVILIDEAQHFAPVWMKIITYFLNPEGLLFLCDDPSQSVFRFFSWRQKGIDVVGKTRWLKVLYRNTREIFEAAFSLITQDDLAMKLLGEDKNFAIPDLENTALRTGPKPVVKHFSSTQSEKQYILTEIIKLVESGVRKEDICILHNQKFVLDDYQNFIKDPAIKIAYSISHTGMEYTAVFIPQAQRLMERTVGVKWEEDLSQQRLAVYTMMTRARSYLYMGYQQKWPKELAALRGYVDWVELEE